MVLLETCVARIAREALCVDQDRFARAAVVRQQALRSVGNELVEIRLTPGDRHTEPDRRRRVVGVEGRQHALELDARSGQVAATDGDARRHDLVVQGRHEHLDAVGAHDTHAFEQMLLGQLGRRGSALRRAAGELVDELVEAGRADGAGRSADDELPACEFHQAGRMSTSEESSCFRYRTTWLNVSGGATCSESVYSVPPLRQSSRACQASASWLTL